jgi:hypothetical protein
MTPSQHTQWKNELLGEILRAVARHESLRDSLVFKGARILNLYLRTQRQSLDIDANLRVEFQRQMPDHRAQVDWFEAQLTAAIRNHFENQEPVRYEVKSVKVVKSPSGLSHPRGWDGLQASIRVIDQRSRDTRGLPTLELDIAAPENLGPDAMCLLSLDGTDLPAYSLHRIAGEKLRAFLSTLPAYCQKIGRQARDVRAKDLHDLARILEAKPIDEAAFWMKAAHEFRLACESRYVDCEGPETFREEWGNTRSVYESEAKLVGVPWADVEKSISEILGFFSKNAVFPLSFPLGKSCELPDSRPS